MPDSFEASLDRRRFIVLAVAFGVDLPLMAHSPQLMAGSPQRHGSAMIDGAIEIEDSRWIENLLQHMAPVLGT